MLGGAMTLQVIGAGGGRTGTCSLKLALEHLGFGPATTWTSPRCARRFRPSSSWSSTSRTLAALCAFLDRPVPAMPFPRTNNSEEFWDLARQLTG
jgi:hypothetical protein